MLLLQRASPIIECLGASDRSLPSIIFDDLLISDIQGRWRSVLPPLLPIVSTTSDTPISLSPYSPVIALWLCWLSLSGVHLPSFRRTAFLAIDLSAMMARNAPGGDHFRFPLASLTS